MTGVKNWSPVSAEVGNGKGAAFQFAGIQFHFTCFGCFFGDFLSEFEKRFRVGIFNDRHHQTMVGRGGTDVIVFFDDNPSLSSSTDAFSSGNSRNAAMAALIMNGR